MRNYYMYLPPYAPLSILFKNFEIVKCEMYQTSSMNRNDVISASPIALYPEKLIFLFILFTPTLILCQINFTLSFSAIVIYRSVTKVIVYSISISRPGQRFILSTTELKPFTASSNTRMILYARGSLFPYVGSLQESFSSFFHL